MPRKRKIDLTGWEEIDEREVPQWVYNRAYKIADKTGRWGGIYLKGKHYRYYIEHLGGQGTIAYRKLRYKYKKEREMRIKKAITALTILAVVAVAGYFLYPILQSGENQSSFQSVGEEFFNPDVTERSIPYVNASGSEVRLVNYRNATDPTWDELITFLQSDDTDEHSYIEDSFVCADFAEMLHNNAEGSGIKAAYVVVDFVVGEGHALNAFNTTDKGLVYVDCTRGFSSPIIAELSNGEKKEYREHDKIAYVVEGKEYGLISIDKATSPEYWFYEEYTKKWEDLEKDIDTYNRDVEEYNKSVEAYERDAEAYEKARGGRTFINDYEEYEQLNKTYNDLKARKKELDIRGNELDARRDRLDERQEELGYYRWEPLGVVTSVEVYW